MGPTCQVLSSCAWPNRRGSSSTHALQLVGARHRVRGAASPRQRARAAGAAGAPAVPAARAAGRLGLMHRVRWGRLQLRRRCTRSTRSWRRFCWRQAGGGAVERLVLPRSGRRWPDQCCPRAREGDGGAPRLAWLVSRYRRRGSRTTCVRTTMERSRRGQ